MDADNLIRMANRIGGFFAVYPDRDEAIEGVALHIARYWDPRMRRQIMSLLDSSDTKSTVTLSPLAVEALQRHRDILLPADVISLPVPGEGESEA